ncbi:hypothetical protein B0J11DRAFT_567101 [Dendryphion nanum]|uniref:Uncharacterized protein n=1 Tax=Dendryphion nanum TaxID=256645 RepID=A0A9P9E0H4_9PLEO|nr:hypothetical protein B0J11DRAFT_567101 [Dendryphion nanum]
MNQSGVDFFPSCTNANTTNYPPRPTGRLQRPVIIPQRRPNYRERGFIQAYAPDLMNCGIDQETFMSFLDGFGLPTAESAAIDAVNVTVGAVDIFLAPFAPGVGFAIEGAVESYQDMRSRMSQNAYLSKMNKQLFAPRGLQCLIFAYDPNLKKSFQETSTSDSYMPRFRNDDGVMGGIELPPCAQLIYPGFHENTENKKTSGSSIGNKLSQSLTQESIKEDHKAQVKYLRDNPNSVLKHLMDPKVVLTEKDIEKQEKKREKIEKKLEKEERKLEKWKKEHPNKEPKEPEKPKIKKGILYLMIANVPSKRGNV